MEYNIDYVREIRGATFEKFYVSNDDWQVTLNIIEAFQFVDLNKGISLQSISKIENFLFKQTSLGIPQIKILIKVILQEINPNCNIYCSENNG